MSWVGAVLAVAVLAALTAIAVSDAKRMTIPPLLVAGLVVGGLGWVAVGGGLAMAGTSPWEHGIGLLVGVGVPAAIILAAEAVGRRWPIYPGDGMLKGQVEASSHRCRCDTGDPGAAGVHDGGGVYRPDWRALADRGGPRGSAVFARG